MQKNENRSTLDTLHKAQVEVDQGPQHKKSHSGKFPKNKTPMAQALRSGIDKWDLMKLESFCKAKDIVNRTKWQPTDWQKNLLYPHT